MQLRLYQQEAVAAIYSHLRERDDNPCVVLPTGTGKSLIIAQLVTDVVRKWNRRVLVLAHIRELLKQNADKIQRLCPDIDIGIYSSGLKRRDTNNPVIVAGIQSIYKRAEEFGLFDLAIADEAHTVAIEGEGMYRTFFSDAKRINPKMRIVGLTATPFRLRGGLICKPDNILNHVCYEANIRDMIAEGYLSPLKSRAGKSKAELDKLHIRGGEFIASEVEGVMDSDWLVRHACREIVELTTDRQAVLIFTSSIKHCKHVAKEIEKISGQECGVITGKTPSLEREELLCRFKGETLTTGLFGEKLPPLKYLANVNVLTTGFDATRTDCVVLLRPTASAGLYTQMVGRGTRLHPGKTDCLILDYGGNILRHGPVDAIEIRDKKPGKGEAPYKECNGCHTILHASIRICPECGYEFPEPKSKVRKTAGEEAILSGEITDTEREVIDVCYAVHTKNGADEHAPKTFRVDYEFGLFEKTSDWLCPEHDGWPRKKFERWWRERSNDPVPDTAAEAVELANLGALAAPLKITVRHVSGEKFDRVIRCELGPKPYAGESQTAMAARDLFEDEEIPF